MRKSRGVTTYSGVHVALTRERGKASTHSCTCGGQAAEWAYTYDDPCPDECVDPRGQKFSLDLARYVPMCRRCHRVYDKTVITTCPKGHAYEGGNVLMDAGKRKCRTCVYERNRRRKPTPIQQARRSELQRLRRAAQRAAVDGGAA
jgi:hypothetical protein